jgi:putative ABC transport system permease protein
MAQSVRERLSELAVLKTLGFENGSVMGMVLAESVLVMLLGGLIGLGLSWFILAGVSEQSGAMLPGGLVLTNEALLTGVLIMLLAGIAAGIFPAMRAMRLTIVEALARS